MVYGIDNLIDYMRPHKTDIQKIQAITFIMKDEETVFSEYTKQYIKDSIFISILIGYPETRITREICLSKDKLGGVRTYTNQIFRPGSMVYKYNEETIEIVSKWNYGRNMIDLIQKDLKNLNIQEIECVKAYIKKNQKKIKGDVRINEIFNRSQSKSNEHDSGGTNQTIENVSNY